MLGYFRSLSVTPLEGTILTPFVEHPVPNPDQITAWDAHHRVLTLWGDPTRVTDLFNRVQGGGGLLAMVQIKLHGKAAHSAFWTRCWQRIAEHGKTLEVAAAANRPITHLSCGCFDSSDAVEFFYYEAREGESAGLILDQLFACVAEVRQSLSCDDSIDRTLTTLACADLATFVKLAAVPPSSVDEPVIALMRLNWSHIGAAGPDVAKYRAELAKLPELPPHVSFYDSFGIFDAQCVLSVAAAAKLLDGCENPQGPQLAFPLFLRRIAPAAVVSERPFDDEDSAEPLRQQLLAVLRRLEQSRPPFRPAAPVRPSRLLLQSLREVARRFIQLGPAGYIPGSRLLLSSTIHVVTQREAAWSEDADERQREETELILFLYSVQQELDRRSSFSLPAHTHYYPSAFDAPLRALAALEMANRLLGAFLRCYRCLAETSLVNVVVAGGFQRSSFERVMGIDSTSVRPGAVGGSVVLRTSIEPRTVGHLTASVFLGWFEHFQATLKHLEPGLNFTALALYRANEDRLAVTIRHYLRTRAKSMLPGNQLIDPDWPHRGVVAKLVEDTTWTCFEPEQGLRSRLAGRKTITDAELERLVSRSFGAPDNARTTTHLPAEWDLHATAAKDPWRAAALAHFSYLMRIRPDEELRFVRRAEVELATTTFGDAPHVPTEATEWNKFSFNVWPPDESLELASLLPFLLLFHPQSWGKERAEAGSATAVPPTIEFQLELAAKLLGRFLHEYALTGRDNEQSVELRTIFRRLLVGLTALELWLRLESGEPPAPPDLIAISNGFQRHARSVLGFFEKNRTQTERASPDVVFDQFKTLLGEVAEPGVADTTDGNPLAPDVIAAQAVFLVRLLTTYGRFDLHFQSDMHAGAALDFLAYFRRFFTALIDDPTTVVREIGRLWELQYAMTRVAGEPPPEYPLPGQFEHDLTHPTILAFLRP